MKFVEFTRSLLIQLCWRKGSMRLVSHVFCPNRIMHGFIANITWNSPQTKDATIHSSDGVSENI